AMRISQLVTEHLGGNDADDERMTEVDDGQEADDVNKGNVQNADENSDENSDEDHDFEIKWECPPVDRREFPSWEELVSYVKEYGKRTHQHYVIRNSTRTSKRNNEARKQKKFQSSMLIDETKFLYYSRPFKCTDAASLTQYRKASTPEPQVNPVSCASKFGCPIQRQCVDGEYYHSDDNSQSSCFRPSTLHNCLSLERRSHQQLRVSSKTCSHYSRLHPPDRQDRDYDAGCVNICAKMREDEYSASNGKQGNRSILARFSQDARKFVATLQTQHMKSMFAVFPEVLLIETTFDTNLSKYKLFSLMVTDAFGNGQHVRVDMRFSNVVRNSDGGRRWMEYVERNGTKCREMWTSYERENVPNLGNDTNNRLESSWQEIKQSVTRSMPLDMSIAALMASQDAIERRWCARLRAVRTRFIEGYDDETKERFVCELIKTQYDLARANKYKYNGLPPFVIIQYDHAAEREADRQVSSEFFGTHPHEENAPRCMYVRDKLKTWMCSCSFSATCILPCRHAIYVRLAEGLRAVEEGMIHKRRQLRHLKKQVLQDAVAAVNSVNADASDGNNSFSVRHICEAIAPRILSRKDKCKTTRQLTDEIADVVADQGMSAYQSILLALADFKALVCDGKVPQVFERGRDATTVEVCEREDVVARGEEQAVVAERAVERAEEQAVAAERRSSASSECEYQIPQFEIPRSRRVEQPRQDKPRAKSKKFSKVDDEADTKSLVPLVVVEAGMKALTTYTWQTAPRWLDFVKFVAEADVDYEIISVVVDVPPVASSKVTTLMSVALIERARSRVNVFKSKQASRTDNPLSDTSLFVKWRRKVFTIASLRAMWDCHRLIKALRCVHSCVVWIRGDTSRHDSQTT
ncbi:TPA: LOW QUALITY PROTEIN: hypothetical protein N0F65_003309, partial [Lagenidium giganteum]